MDSIENIAFNVRTHRKRKGLSQEQLSCAAQLGKNYIGDIERAQCNPSVECVDQIAKALGVAAFTLYLPKQAKILRQPAPHSAASTAGAGAGEPAAAGAIASAGVGANGSAGKSTQIDTKTNTKSSAKPSTKPKTDAGLNKGTDAPSR